MRRRRRKVIETFFNRPAKFIRYNYILLKCKLVKNIISSICKCHIYKFYFYLLHPIKTMTQLKTGT